MPITITVTGVDGNDALQQYCDFIEAMNHHVEKLKIAAKGPEIVPPAEVEAPKRRGRPPKEIAARSAEAEDGDRQEAEAQKANGKPSPTREDVIVALNRYAESHGGQVAGRDVMKQVCGVTRLVDCAPTDYPKLLEALGA